MSVCRLRCGFEISSLSKLDEPFVRISHGMSLCPSIMSADLCNLIAAPVSLISVRSGCGFASSARTTYAATQQTMHAIVSDGNNICDDLFVIQFAFEIVFAVFVPSPIFTTSFQAQRYKFRVSAYRLSVEVDPSTAIINRRP